LRENVKDEVENADFKIYCVKESTTLALRLTRRSASAVAGQGVKEGRCSYYFLSPRTLQHLRDDGMAVGLPKDEKLSYSKNTLLALLKPNSFPSTLKVLVYLVSSIFLFQAKQSKASGYLTSTNGRQV